MKTSILVPVGTIAVLAAAVVLASPMRGGSEGVAKTPNRAEVFLAASCGAVTPVTVSDQHSWHSALGSKRALDRDLVLTAGSAQPATGCLSIEG